MPYSPEIPGHPLLPLDPIESRTFTRDLLFAGIYGLAENTSKVWLATRARARRDLLWACRNVLNLDRLDEAHHRPPADFIMSVCKSPHGFGNLRDPRGNGKTSLSTRGGTVWVLIQDPIECIERGWPIRGRESRIGITTLKMDLTYDFMRVALDDMNNELLRWAFPELFPSAPRRWSIKGIELRRGLTEELESLRDHPLFATYPSQTKWPDPTISPRALESGVAGPHSHGEFIDDPVNTKTWNSETNIDNAIHGIRQLFSVTRPEQGFRLVTGNHWTAGDVADTIDRQDGNWRVFMRSMTACTLCRDGWPTDSSGIPERRADNRWVHQHADADGTPLPTFTWLMKEADGSVPDAAVIYAGCATKHIAMSQYENSPYDSEATTWDSKTLPRFRYFDVPGAITDPPKLGWRLAYPSTTTPGDLTTRLSDLRIGITYDPAHGADEGTSRHAIAVWGWLPDDRFAWLESYTWPSADALDALDTLVWLIHRLHPNKVGIESVGYQRVIRPLIWRELEARRTPCCFVRVTDPKRLGCTVHRLDPLVRSPIAEDDIIPIPRTREQGRKSAYIRDALGPLINTRAILLPASPAPGAAESSHAIDVFPVTITDLIDAAAMMPHLFEGRPPATREAKMERRRTLKFRQLRHRKTAGVTGYGDFGRRPR